MNKINDEIQFSYGIRIQLDIRLIVIILIESDASLIILLWKKLFNLITTPSNITYIIIA